MKKSIFFFLIIFLSTCIYAQTPTIESISNKLAEQPITKGDFLQIKTINSAKGKRELKSNGKFIFSLDGIMWETLKPFPSKMIIGTDFIAQVSSDGTKKITDTSDNQVFANVASTIVALFSNDSDKLKSNFNISIKKDDGNKYLIELQPKDQTIASVMSKIEMNVVYDGQKAEIESIFMSEASGNSTKYVLSNKTYPKELTADEKANFTSK